MVFRSGDTQEPMATFTVHFRALVEFQINSDLFIFLINMDIFLSGDNFCIGFIRFNVCIIHERSDYIIPLQLQLVMKRCEWGFAFKQNMYLFI